MTVTRCDRCSKVFEDTKYSFCGTLYFSTPKKFDLCSACCDELARWIYEKQDEKRQFYVLGDDNGNFVTLFGKTIAYRDEHVAEREIKQHRLQIPFRAIVKKHTLGDGSFKEQDLLFLEKTTREYIKELDQK